LADKIRKALDKPIDANYKDKPFTDVLKEFEKHLQGIPFRRGTQDPAGNMDLNLGQVPLGTAIQAYTDLMPHIRFVVRDYGILMATKNNLPPGAVELYNFWKSDAGKAEKKPDAADELLNWMIDDANARLEELKRARDQDDRPQPPARGKIKAYDSKAEL